MRRRSWTGSDSWLARNVAVVALLHCPGLGVVAKPISRPHGCCRRDGGKVRRTGQVLLLPAPPPRGSLLQSGRPSIITLQSSILARSSQNFARLFRITIARSRSKNGNSTSVFFPHALKNLNAKDMTHNWQLGKQPQNRTFSQDFLPEYQQW